jgi:hypothetical protein
MNNPMLPQITPISTAQCLIDTPEAAIEMGRWDAERGAPCSPDSYVYPNSCDDQRAHLRSDYVGAYVRTKGL